MPQVNKPGYAVGFQAVRDVRHMRSSSCHSMRGVPERVAELAQLAHTSRVVPVGQPVASIVCEVNQTITASVGGRKAGPRWRAEAESTARVEKTRKALRPMIRDGEGAAYIIEPASCRPEATSTPVGLLMECRGRHW
jgi:hypothetical protein